jgi:hypothetical protein
MRSGPLCACPADGFYDAFSVSNASSYNCVPCSNYKCQVCSSTSNTVCDLCYGKYRNSTTCQCLPGYYDTFESNNSSTYDCIRCPIAECQTCNSSVPATCINCFGSNRLPLTCTCALGLTSLFNLSLASTYSCILCANPKCSTCPDNVNTCT